MRLAFMGTPEFALPTLSALIHAPDHDLRCVITQADKPRGRGMQTQSPPVKDMALNHGLDVYQPLTLKNNTEFYDLMGKGDFDGVIVVAYGKMIPTDILSVPRFGFINVHASLLPKYRGASPINRAIIDGCETTGVSIMRIDAGMDSGPVFLQAKTVISYDDNAVSLSDRLSTLGAEKLIATLSLIEQGKIEPFPQDNTEATYAPMLKKEDGEIDWSKDPVGIYNKIRGLVPWPCSYTYLDGKMLKILSASFEIGETGVTEGTFLKHKTGLKISCRGGFIIPHTVQLEGKKVLDSLSFSRGLKSENLTVGR